MKLIVHRLHYNPVHEEKAEFSFNWSISFTNQFSHSFSHSRENYVIHTTLKYRLLHISIQSSAQKAPFLKPTPSLKGQSYYFDPRLEP